MKRLILLLACCGLVTAGLLAASQSAHLPDTAPQPTARLRNTVAESVTGQIVGRARVLDGDSIAVAGVAIRIFGIDAPEWRQRCRGADGPRTRDKFARLVATCYQGEDDVARFMVRRGLALDWPRYSGGAYADAESEARSAERGLWQGAFAPPWNWRHGRAALTSRP